MYRDQFIEVTPSVLVLDSYYLPFMGAKVIPIQDIDRVWRDFDSHIPPALWPGSRCAGRGGARAVIRRIRRIRPCQRLTTNNLIVSVKCGKTFRVSIRAEDPHKAYLAIKAAMDTFY